MKMEEKPFAQEHGVSTSLPSCADLLLTNSLHSSSKHAEDQHLENPKEDVCDVKLQAPTENVAAKVYTPEESAETFETPHSSNEVSMASSDSSRSAFHEDTVAEDDETQTQFFKHNLASSPDAVEGAANDQRKVGEAEILLNGVPPIQSDSEVGGAVLNDEAELNRDVDEVSDGTEDADGVLDQQEPSEAHGSSQTADEEFQPYTDDNVLDAKFKQLLEKTDTYSRKLTGGGGGFSSPKEPISSSTKPTKGLEPGSRAHILSEKEEDDILLKEAEEAEDTGVRFNQPECITGVMKGYQVDGLNWLYQIYKLKINGILADEMGLGKTLQTISLLGFLLCEKNVKGPHLVICPRSTLENWFKEFSRWCPILRVVRLHGKKEERDEIITNELQANRFDVCLTTYEMIIKEKNRLTRYRWTYLIMDEAHRIKNEKSVLSEVVRMFKPQRRLLITGTPLQNNLKELWALLNFLMPQLFDSSDDFGRLFDFSRMSRDDHQARAVTLLHKILRPFMLRRLKSDVERDLPPKREVYIFIGMSKLQKKIYADILEKNIEVLNAMTGSKTQMLNVLMQLRKCCNHPYLFDGVEPGPPYIEGHHLVEACGKMVLLDKLLPRLMKDGSRVLLFSQMTRLIDIIDDYCRWKEYSYCRIDGSTPGMERQERIDDFNSPGSDKFIFLLSTRAGGLGINLATADIVVLFDSDFNPQMDLQAMDRAHRIGQKKKVVVYRFVTEHSVEERIVERAAKKLMLESLIIQKGRLSSSGQPMGPNAQELHEMIQFGAQEVYRTQDESSITDADVDIILADADKRSGDIEEKLSSLGNQFDLSNMSLDGGLHMYAEQSGGHSHEKKSGKQGRTLQFFDLGDRKTKWKPEEKKPRKIARRQLTGWRAEIQGGYDFQFFDHERLDELDEIQHIWEEWMSKRRAEREEKEVKVTNKETNEATTSECGKPDARSSSNALEPPKKKLKLSSGASSFETSSITAKPKEEKSVGLGDADNPDIYLEPPSLKSLSEDHLRRLLHVVEFHMMQNHDHSGKTKAQLFKRCEDLVKPPSMDDFTFTKTDFNECLADFELMLNDGRAWELQIPAATMCRSNRASRLGVKPESDVLSDAESLIKTKATRKSIRQREKELSLEDLNDPDRPMVFTEEMRKEKERLISKGFINWNRTEFTKIVNSLIVYGRERLDEICKTSSQFGGKSYQDIKRYIDVFFERYNEIEGGEKIMSRINKAESARDAVTQRNEAILQNVEEQVTRGLSKPQDLVLPKNLPESKYFTEDEDKVILWGLYEHGATAYQKTHAASRYYWYYTRGFFSIATKSLKLVEERCKQIGAAVESQWLLRQKKELTASSKSGSTGKGGNVKHTPPILGRPQRVGPGRKPKIQNSNITNGEGGCDSPTPSESLGSNSRGSRDASADAPSRQSSMGNFSRRGMDLTGGSCGGDVGSDSKEVSGGIESVFRQRKRGRESLKVNKR